MADRIRPALCDEIGIGLFYFGTEERIIAPTLRLVDIEVGWHDIVVAHEGNRNFKFQQFGSVGVKTVKPTQFLIEFGSRCGIAIRQIETSDQDAINGSF